MRNPQGEWHNPAGTAPDALQFIGRSFYAVGRTMVRVRNDTSSQPPDPELLGRRPLYLAAVVLAIASLPLHMPLLFIAGLLVFAVTFVPELWYRFCLHELLMERQPVSHRAVFGDVVELRLVIENRKPLPLPWMELVDEYPEPLPVLGLRLSPSAKPERALLHAILPLWAYQRVRRTYRVLASARGAHQFGPTQLRITDPFGILTREAEVPLPATLLVHPLIAPLERFGLPPNAPFGERKARRRVLDDPLRVVGTREYVPGDEPRRIHWKATARTGTLQSKVYEPSARHTVAVFLDTRTYTHLHLGYDPDLAELAICAAASVTAWAIEQGYAVGMYSNGAVSSAGAEEEASERLAAALTAAAKESKEKAQRLAAEIARYSGALRLRIPPASRSEQLLRILDGLARVLPYHGTPMSQVVLSELGRLPMGATVVYIGTEGVLDVPMILALRRARAQGHGVSLLLTQGDEAGGGTTDGAQYLGGLDAHVIGGRQTWRDLASDVLGPDGDRLATSWKPHAFDPFGHAASRAPAGGQAEGGGKHDGERGDGPPLESADGANGERGDRSGTRPARALVVE
ncbi:MAG TPA: DUF58 domain-containing protein [Ktedonobacterales bacterium]|nr:DUF58 domain-containing protein [Ktedonobacterales bacterium]